MLWNTGKQTLKKKGERQRVFGFGNQRVREETRHAGHQGNGSRRFCIFI